MNKVGVFICWCGSNIAGTVDVEKITEEVSRLDGVVHAQSYRYFCSDPGQAIVETAVKEKGLDRVVIAACSPTMHEATFRRTVARAGLNPYRCEIANIREQCSWVHQSAKDEATAKAVKIIASIVEKAKLDEELHPIHSALIKRALVLGGGISGLKVASDIARSGYDVILVERESTLGGRVMQLSRTFPDFDPATDIVLPLIQEMSEHPRIELMLHSELEEVAGHVGQFKVKLRKKACSVDHDKCTACRLCIEQCPVELPSEFDEGLGKRKAIDVPFPDALSGKPVINRDRCLFFKDGGCEACKNVCEPQAIDFEQQDLFVEREVGAIVLSTGYSLFPKEKVAEYGYGKYPDVISGLEFERLNAASGPTGGEIRRPSDGSCPTEVVFIQCVGSRDQEKGVPYCSRICCLYTAKQVALFKQKVPDGQAYVFYMDVRSGGKGHEEFVQRVQEENEALYLRGRVSRVFEDNGKIVVWGADTLSGRKIEIAADMVVLATAVVPRSDSKELAKKVRVATDEYGFFSEAHIKLRPVESQTAGIFLAGCAHSPKDITDSISQAGCAASKVKALFAAPDLVNEPTVAFVDEDVCVGCGICVGVCPYEARILHQRKKVALVEEALCQGCGGCVAACPNGASQMRNQTTDQILAMIDAIY
jgi:heterodisulfide reductase subunit A2